MYQPLLASPVTERGGELPRVTTLGGRIKKALLEMHGEGKKRIMTSP